MRWVADRTGFSPRTERDEVERKGEVPPAAQPDVADHDSTGVGQQSIEHALIVSRGVTPRLAYRLGWRTRPGQVSVSRPVGFRASGDSTQLLYNPGDVGVGENPLLRRSGNVRAEDAERLSPDSGTPDAPADDLDDVTRTGIVLVPMSHLPDEVAGRLQRFITELESRVQADVHTVGRARSAHRAFKRNWLVMDNFRALIACHAGEVAEDQDLEWHDVGSGGWALRLVHEDRIMVFRWKKGDVDRYGRLRVTADTDSTLTRCLAGRQAQMSFFDDVEDLVRTPVVDDDNQEIWVLGWLLPATHLGIERVVAAWPAGFANRRAPFKLILADPHDFDLEAPTPPTFPGDPDDLWDDQADEDTGT